MLYIFYVECRDKMLRNRRYNAYSVVLANGKQPRVDFAFARQPWAIKRTTLTALRDEGIYITKFIHLNNGATPTALRDKTIMGVMSLIMKRKMICVISSRKIRQITRPFDAF